MRRGLARSYLYVPGNRPDWFGSGAASGTDALILDIEDSVPGDAKAGARQSVAQWLTGRTADSPQLWVRINANSTAADVASIVTAAIAGVVVPKAEPDLLAEVGACLMARERDLGLPHAHLLLLPLVETARGLLAVVEVAAADRVARLGIGEADLAAELGVRPATDRAEMFPFRSQVVLASAAAGISSPVGPTSTDVRNLSNLRPSTETLLRQGFGARTAVSPSQLRVVNEVFTPSVAEVTEARKIVEAFEAATHAGRGTLTGSDGRMVDAATVRSARDVLARAES
jgi:citrate lyase subunit beta/citryl-CoA lyase